MKLKKTIKNNPYIELDNGNKLIFSTITEHPDKGFKYIVFSGIDTQSISTSSSKAKKKKEIKISKNISFTCDLDFRTGRAGVPLDARGSLTKISEGFLKKIFSEIKDKDGYISRDKIPVIQERIDEKFKNETDEWDEDPDATEFNDIKEEKPKKSKEKITKNLKIKVKPNIKIKGTF